MKEAKSLAAESLRESLRSFRTQLEIGGLDPFSRGSATPTSRYLSSRRMSLEAIARGKRRISYFWDFEISARFSGFSRFLLDFHIYIVLLKFHNSLGISTKSPKLHRITKIFTESLRFSLCHLVMHAKRNKSFAERSPGTSFHTMSIALTRTKEWFKFLIHWRVKHIITFIIKIEIQQ